MNSALVFVIVSFYVFMVRGSSLRERVGVTRQPQVADASSGTVDAGSASARRGGVRKRVKAAQVITTPALRRRGGVKQRVAKADTATSSSSASTYTPFNDLLRQQFTSGKLSAPRLLELATAAHRQGCDDVGNFARFTNATNAHRNVVRTIGWPELCPELDWIDISEDVDAHPILCPIAVAEKLCNCNPTRFNERLRGEEGNIREYWAGLRSRNSPIFNAGLIDPENTIPCGLHGDKAATSKTQGLFTVSWNSLLSKPGLSTRESRFVYTVVKSSDLTRAKSERLFKRLAWAFNALNAGVWPETDWEGH